MFIPMLLDYIYYLESDDCGFMGFFSNLYPTGLNLTTLFYSIRDSKNFVSTVIQVF